MDSEAQDESSAEETSDSSTKSEEQQKLRKAEQNKKKDLHKRYQTLRGNLIKRKIWKKDSETVIDAHLQPLLALEDGYGIACDQLEALLVMTNEQIMECFTKDTALLEQPKPTQTDLPIGGEAHTLTGESQSSNTVSTNGEVPRRRNEQRIFQRKGHLEKA